MRPFKSAQPMPGHGTFGGKMRRGPTTTRSAGSGPCRVAPAWPGCKRSLGWLWLRAESVVGGWLWNDWPVLWDLGCELPDGRSTRGRASRLPPRLTGKTDVDGACPFRDVPGFHLSPFVFTRTGYASRAGCHVGKAL